MKKVLFITVALVSSFFMSCKKCTYTPEPIPTIVTVQIPLPAGCNSIAGYSTTTGQPCDPNQYTTVTSNGNIVQVTYTIPLTITSVNATSYIGKTAIYSTRASGTNALSFVLNNQVTPNDDDVTSTTLANIVSTDAVIEGNGYRLDKAIQKHFVLTVILITPSVINGYYRVTLKQVRIFADASLQTGPKNIDLLPVATFQTGYQFINN